MTEPLLLQKLLRPDGLRRFGEGSSLLEGVVASLSEMNAFTDPAQIIDAHGFGGSSTTPTHVDVLRFRSAPLMELDRPSPDPDRGPSFENGLAPTRLGIVPVWQLAPTRVPTGAEIWRFGTGEARMLSRYDGPALGWSPARVYVPPRQLIGPRVEIDGLDLPAAFTADERRVEVVAVGREVPPGFATARPLVHHRFLDPAECDAIFEVTVTATWRGTRCRLIERADSDAVIRLGAEALTGGSDVGIGIGIGTGIETVEAGVFQARVPMSDLDDVRGSRRELTP